MRVVIDTNCLLLSIPPKNPEYWLYIAFKEKAFDWVLSTEILLEYEERLSSFYSPLTSELVLNILLNAPNIIKSEPFYFWNLIEKDPDDNKFADLAISANVSCLVTNDHHFQVLKETNFPSVKVVSIDEFRQILGF